MVDITDEMAAQEALRANEQLLRTLTEALPVGVLQIDAERRIVHRNARVVELLGAAPEGVDGQLPSLCDQLAGVRPADRERVDEAVEATLRFGKELDVEATIETGDPGGRRGTFALRPLVESESDQVTGAIVCVSDITEAARLRAELTERATYDSLTRTLNRAATIAALEGALSETAAGVGVVFVDLDKFKAVNDRRGHAAGDRLLAHAAGRLVAAAREGDVVGRFGGDEFLVICPGVADGQAALQIAERLAASLREPTDFDGEPLVPDASVGVAWSPTGVVTADALIARADMAMYAAKSGHTGAPVLR
jgi:diguanylate cyclase (GGDEF)-like protein/PAS domain S-box-containing protein